MNGLSNMNGFWKKLSPAMLAVAGILCAAGTAFAVSGVSTLATSGDGGGPTARGAQEPLGMLSATPPAETLPGTPPAETLPEQGSGGGGPGGGGGGPGGGELPGGGEGGPGGGELPAGGEGGNRGVQGSGGSAPSANSGAGAPTPTAATGAPLASTGLLLVPLLLTGAGLLCAGAMLRRRSASTPSSP